MAILVQSDSISNGSGSRDIPYMQTNKFFEEPLKLMNSFCTFEWTKDFTFVEIYVKNNLVGFCLFVAILRGGGAGGAHKQRSFHAEVIRV